MGLADIYKKGEKELRMRDIGFLLDGVETEFVISNNRRILDQYTIRQRCIDGVMPTTECTVLGVNLKTPIIMSAMTMPIPAIVENGLMEVAKGLHAAGSLIWTGTPIPSNLEEIVAIGVPVAANVKPQADREKMFDSIEKIQAAGVNWIGIEIDSGQGTKVHDRQMASDCSPLSLDELKEIRKRVSIPIIFKGVLSKEDAQKSLEAGADGIFLSNHGAHTLDYLPHPFQVMDEIVQIIKDEAAIIVDSGFRRGSDIFKGLAFGAQVVGLGRPILYGLAANGAEGVRNIIEEMTEELKRFMSMTGSVDPEHVERDLMIKG
ncbi:MAG: alpha-hydroxy-acid oxidizing protein [Deltaproteobacteria bacterium]|nr:alpha-hydroxy-acid oxidizing protein [Deltaproteobacteria bacterium]